MSDNKALVFLCGARDYHAMDWYNRAVENLGYSNISILTDLIESEGFPKIINEKDRVYKMIVIDSLLFKTQSRIGNVWRNILKALVLPFQVIYVKKFAHKNKDAIFYAHSMYYIWLAYLSKVQFIGRPQGSDILLKPFKSKIYRYLSVRAMKAAKNIIVDSINMKNVITKLSPCSDNVVIIMNGIDINSIVSIREQVGSKMGPRKNILSLRGITSLYRIENILQSRQSSSCIEDYGMNFIYPYYDKSYKNIVSTYLISSDIDMGKLDKKVYYETLLNTMLAISIPKSDSSPRSVFEAIFCGCAVAIVYNQYYDYFPNCMKSRVILVDLSNDNWFEDAVIKSKTIAQREYIPTKEALELFDQNKTFHNMYKCFLGEVNTKRSIHEYL